MLDTLTISAYLPPIVTVKSVDGLIGKFDPVITNSAPPKLKTVVLLNEVMMGRTFKFETVGLKATPYPF